jgi:hypothetical protein
MKRMHLLVLLIFASCYFVRSSIHNIKSGDVKNGPLKDDLLEVMDRNPNFNYANATEDEIYAVFGDRLAEKLTFRYPRVRIFENKKIRFDLTLMYSMVVTRVIQSPGITKYIPHESVDIFFYLLKGRGQYYIISHSSSKGNEKYNTDPIETSADERWVENRRKDRCDYYFYHTFSLGTSRGNKHNIGYEGNCDFDYDLEYWKDPIYQPIWNPKDMGTLEQLDIKEVNIKPPWIR